MWNKRLIVVGCVAAFSASPLLAADASRFPLTKAVPADVYLLVAARHNPEREFLDQYWARVFDAIKKSGIVEEVWELISGSIHGEDREKFDALVEQCEKLCAGVQWGELFGQETVYMGRASFPVWESVVLTRNSEELVGKNCAGLRDIFAAIEKQTEKAVTVSEWEYENAKLCSLRVAVAPISITVGRRGDVLVLALGDGLLKDALKRLGGKSDTPGLTSTARFQAAFERLPDAEDSLFFFDASQTMTGIRTMLGAIRQQVVEKADKEKKASPQRHKPKREESDDGDADDASGEADEDDSPPPAHRRPHPRGSASSNQHAEMTPDQVFDVLNSILDNFAIWDYIAATERTEGFRVFAESYTALVPHAESRAAYRVFVPRGRFEQFDRFIPVDATGFSIGRGINLEAGYDWVLKLVKDHCPNGDEVLQRWAELQEEHDFDLRRDVFSWFDGPMMVVSMPGGSVGKSGGVLMVKVKNERRAVKQVRRLLDHLNALLGEHQPMTIEETQIDGREGFYRVSHPWMMMMQMRPIVWGSAEGYLIFGTAERAVSRCLKTAAGKVPSIRKNKRFQAEGIMPEGAVVSASFLGRLRRVLELAAGLSGATMAMGMMSMVQPTDEEGGKILRTVPSILGKLTKVATKMNFYLSESSVTTFNGSGWRSTSVTNYKDPKTLKSEYEEESDDEGNDSPTPKAKKKHKDASEDDDD